MTDIKQYLPYCFGRKANYINPDGLKQEVVILGIVGESKDHTIIPHMRKLSSLTEDEARELVVLHYGESYREELTKEHYCKDELRKPQLEFVSIVGYMVHYRAWGRSNEFSLLTKYNFEQFHYLTTIGIAWWATEDMWESGALIEIKNKK